MTKINENYMKNPAEQAELSYDLAKDPAVWNAYLTDNKVNSSPLSTQRKKICERFILALTVGEIHFKNAGSDYQKMVDVNATLDDSLKLRYANLLSRGGRLIVEIPPLESKRSNPNQFLDWLLGDNAVSTKLNNQKAEAENKPVFLRPAATHSYTRKESGKEHLLKPFNPKHLLRFISDFWHGRHMGMTIGLQSASQAGKENGEHGCVYLYWKPPTKKKPGILMWGTEGSAPGKKDIHGNFHGPSGKSPELSPTSSRKYRNELFENYPIRPAAQDGVKVIFSNADLATVTSLTADNFDMNLLSAPVGKKIARVNEHVAKKSTSVDKMVNELKDLLSELKTKLQARSKREAEEVNHDFGMRKK